MLVALHSQLHFNGYHCALQQVVQHESTSKNSCDLVPHQTSTYECSFAVGACADSAIQPSVELWATFEATFSYKKTNHNHFMKV